MKKPKTPRLRRLVRLRRLLAVAGLILGLAFIRSPLSAAPALAVGEDLRIKSMKLSVWPEYDDPRLLVIYEGEFSDGGTFPREVRFRAPKDAAIQMVCALTPSKEHKCQVYDTIVEGDYKTIVFTLPIPTFYFEYYGSGIEGSPDKSINYQFVNPPYAVDSMDVEIQQPLKATNFQINPPSTSATSDTQGLKYFNYRFSAVPADKALGFAITYSKTDPNPSVKKKSDAAAGEEGQNNSLIVMASVAGLASVLGASYYISSKRKRQKRYATRAMSSASMRQAERSTILPKTAPPKPADWPMVSDPRPVAPSASGSVFCSTCGTRLEAGDVFCYRCGQLVPQRGSAAQTKRK